jgi:hypothetical protein
MKRLGLRLWKTGLPLGSPRAISGVRSRDLAPGSGKRGIWVCYTAFADAVPCMVHLAGISIAFLVLEDPRKA